MKKILYVILHGSVYSERKHHIKSTWGKNSDCLFYSDYEDIDLNVIKISDRSDYHSNEEKHINIINKLNKELPEYEWFFFCDDDTFVNTEKLNDNLDHFDIDSVHGSVIQCWSHDKNLKYCSGGAGYLIHRTLLKKITNIPILNTGYSDVTLGIYLRENNITSTNHSYFNSRDPKFYNVKDDELKQFISFHYIKTKEDHEHILKNLK
jgi:hypothetical protein